MEYLADLSPAALFAITVIVAAVWATIATRWL
jgi:hypothetical protein